MTFKSILFPSNQDTEIEQTVEMPSFFMDLNLDQVTFSIMKQFETYNLEPFFYTPLQDLSVILYRQEVSRDLENKDLNEKIKAFSKKMIIMRRYLNSLSEKSYQHHINGWFLEAVLVYCEAVRSLSQDLSQITFHSQGLKEFQTYISNYLETVQFKKIDKDAALLKQQLVAVRYCVIIKREWVHVRKYKNEIDYCKEVEHTFEKFKQGAVKNYLAELIETAGMNHIEAQILDGVVKLYPDVFAFLSQFYDNNQNFLDATIRRFDREIQFYLSYLDYIEEIKKDGLSFCYPQVSVTTKEVSNLDGFDIALAKVRSFENAKIVTNSFSLTGNERIMIVSGPNQGGKTTFARTFGQLHFLASLGLPVPGTQSQLFLFDKLFTHFEKEEDIRNLRGKLQDDLFRLNLIMEEATPNSIIIMNEIFTSTTLQDAVFLSMEIMKKINQLDLLCVCVTFIDELSTMSEKTISMVSSVVPDNPAERTFKIERRPADGLAYALSIAEKYHTTYRSIKERIQS